MADGKIKGIQFTISETNGKSKTHIFQISLFFTLSYSDGQCHRHGNTVLPNANRHRPSSAAPKWTSRMTNRVSMEKLFNYWGIIFKLKQTSPALKATSSKKEFPGDHLKTTKKHHLSYIPPDQVMKQHGDHSIKRHKSSSKMI